MEILSFIQTGTGKSVIFLSGQHRGVEMHTELQHEVVEGEQDR